MGVCISNPVIVNSNNGSASRTDKHDPHPTRFTKNVGPESGATRDLNDDSEEGGHTTARTTSFPPIVDESPPVRGHTPNTHSSNHQPGGAIEHGGGSMGTAEHVEQQQQRIVLHVDAPSDANHSSTGSGADGTEGVEGGTDDDDIEASELRPGQEFVATMAAFSPGESVGEKYEVVEVLSCGTVGRTYRARSTAHDAQCVFKVVCFLSREAFVEGVREDQKILTRLQHANVLPVFDVMEDVHHENMIVVTSYVPNRNVSRHCGLLNPAAGGGGAQHMEHLRMMLRDIGVGIRVLHSHHVFHHNIKLENILETKDGGCCVADAGFSRLFSSQPVEALVDLQNGGLLPPEYFLEDYDLSQQAAAARMDTWSFGWVMHQLAYGTAPYEITRDMSIEDIRRVVISHKLKCPVNCGARCDLWEVIKWSLEKKPKDRPSIMKLLRHQFFRIANGQSFVEPGNSSSFAAGSMMNVHKNLTVEHTGFVMSVVLGKGPHAENFLVHLPGMPTKLFVLKCFSESLAARMQHMEPPQVFELRKHLAQTRKIRHPTLAHYYEIVDNEENTFATQAYFARGNLAINFPHLEQGGLVVRMIADVLRGLVRLHDVGIYHLNVKPSNVFYTDDELDHHFALSDFGPVQAPLKEIYDEDSTVCNLGVPEHVQELFRERKLLALPFIDTLCVGLLAASVFPDVRMLVWDQLYARVNPTVIGTTGTGDVVDVERVLGRLILRQQKQPEIFPTHYMEFVTTALTSCKTARELMAHPYLASEITPEDAAITYFDVLDEDITKAIRDKFVCRNENRLADLLGHGGFLAPNMNISLGAGGLARCVSAQSMNAGGEQRRGSYNPSNGGPGGNDDTLSVSLQERSIMPSEYLQRISYAFVHKMCCGLCKKELKYVVYRCSECSDYLRCGKCVSMDSHGHPLAPMVIENVCHPDADDEEMKLATLVPPAALNKHALEEIEMQAELPAGMLLAAARAAGGDARSSFRKQATATQRKDAQDLNKSGGDGPSLSRPASMSMGHVSPLAKRPKAASPDEEIDADEDDNESTAGGGASSHKKAPKRLLMEHEANEDTNPQTEIHQCRQNNELELMLHNFELLVVPPEIFDPPVSHIVHLNLSNNALVELPHDISFLHNLQKLSLANNKLESLPDSVGDLGELQYLDVSHNALQDLPQSLMFADKLETIAMDYNNCSEIPGVVLDMPQMRVIYLAENRNISKWPPVSQLVAIGPIKFGLDNEPLLWQEFHDIKEQLQSRVTVMWNKIYPDEIIPHLFCGSLRSAQSLAVYDRLNITSLLTVGRGLEPTVIDGMRHKVVIVDDIEGATIDHSFREAVEFVDEALSANSGCLVHCFAGMSRSATTVIAYLMIRKGMRLDEAYCTTRRGRPAIYPNAGFFAQLLSLDAKLFPDGRPLDMQSMERHIIPST